MTTSGTAIFNPDMLELVEEAFERAGIEGPRTGNDFRTARRSLNLISAEWANRGLNLWTVDSGSVSLTPGTASYTLPADTIDLLDAVVRIDSTDYVLDRIGTGDYAAIPNKTTQARPVQIYVTRNVPPAFTLWPVPDSTYTVVYWRMRRMQDVTAGSNTTDVPFRFYPALVSALAYQIAMKKPEAFQRVPFLKSAYEEQFDLASQEDRERVSLRFMPWT